MWRDSTSEPIRLNWNAILSISGTLAVGVALWAGLIQVVSLLMR